MSSWKNRRYPEGQKVLTWTLVFQLFLRSKPERNSHMTQKRQGPQLGHITKNNTATLNECDMLPRQVWNTITRGSWTLCSPQGHERQNPTIGPRCILPPSLEWHLIHVHFKWTMSWTAERSICPAAGNSMDDHRWHVCRKTSINVDIFRTSALVTFLSACAPAA